MYIFLRFISLLPIGVSTGILRGWIRPVTPCVSLHCILKSFQNHLNEIRMWIDTIDHEGDTSHTHSRFSWNHITAGYFRPPSVAMVPVNRGLFLAHKYMPYQETRLGLRHTLALCLVYSLCCQVLAMLNQIPDQCSSIFSTSYNKIYHLSYISVSFHQSSPRYNLCVTFLIHK